MNASVESSHLNGLLVIKNEVARDERGFFMEVFRKDVFARLGVTADFVQDNHSRSGKGVVRGLHFQWDPPQGKLIRVTKGKAFVVAVDIRKGSPSIGQWYGRTISEDDGLQVWAMPGFATGFCVLSEVAEIQYKCTGFYNPRCESGIRWNDSQIGIRWPVDQPILSEKDARAGTFAEWLRRPEAEHFRF